MRKWNQRLPLTLVIALMLSPGINVRAGDANGEKVRVLNTWARATFTGSMNGAAYMTIFSNCPGGDRLVGLSSTVSQRTEVHSHVIENGVMAMRHITDIEIVAGTPLVLQPGGHHVMLIGLKKLLAPGDQFKLTLVFEKTGTVIKNVFVQSISSVEYQGKKSRTPKLCED